MNIAAKDVAVLDKLFDDMDLLMKNMRLQNHDDHAALEIFDIFADLGRTLVDADRASFWRWDKKNKQLVTAAATGTKQITIAEDAGIVGQSIMRKEPLIVNDPASNPHFNAAVDEATGYETKSILVLPVSNCRGEIIGAFQAINKEQGARGFDATTDVKRLSIAAFICGLALESDMFMNEAEHDKLTGLKNRYSFYKDWRLKYFPALEEQGKDDYISFILCDIDFFKKVNDTYSHEAGDAILKMVADILRRCMPTGCNAYRWGGEEFLLTLAGKTLTETADIAENIRREVAQTVCPYRDKEIRVTMSFGCASFAKAYDLDGSIDLADRRLYKAKDSNRNCVVYTGEVSDLPVEKM